MESDGEGQAKFAEMTEPLILYTVFKVVGRKKCCLVPLFFFLTS